MGPFKQLLSALRGRCQAHLVVASSVTRLSRNIYFVGSTSILSVNCGRFWNGQTTMGAAYAVLPLLPACRFNPAHTR